MEFAIKLTPQALTHLRAYRKGQQKRIVDAIKQQLCDQPLAQTRNRKPLRENPLSRWELRVGEFRVFYDVNTSDQVVEVKAIGHKKHNRLFLGGKEFQL